MKRSVLLLSLGLASAACAHHPEQASIESSRGSVLVAGLAPSDALGAVDTSKLVNAPRDTSGEGSPSASDGKSIAVEGVAPSAVLGAIDTKKLVTPAPPPKSGAKPAP